MTLQQFNSMAEVEKINLILSHLPNGTLGGSIVFKGFRITTFHSPVTGAIKYKTFVNRGIEGTDEGIFVDLEKETLDRFRKQSEMN